MSSVTVEELVKLYDLKPHPEGGFYSEYYRDKGIIPKSVLPSRYKGDRNYSTNVYFLLPEGKKSKLHRIASDESWHFYLGDPLTIVQISPKGKVETILLGQDVGSGQKVAHVVPAGYWFGAYPAEGSRFSFVGCTVAPGFDFADFEMGDHSTLLEFKKFPEAKKVIERLTDAS